MWTQSQQLFLLWLCGLFLNAYPFFQPRFLNTDTFVNYFKPCHSTSSHRTFGPTMNADVVKSYKQQMGLYGAGGKTRRTVIKFGGSSLASSDRLYEVATLVKDLIQKGDRPIMVCSAMGKTTNNLLSAGQLAMQGKVFTDAIRTLHVLTANEVGATNSTKLEIEELLTDLEKLLNGISYLRELTPRTLDYLVSFGERLSVRLMAAQLNSIGVPAQSFDAFNLGLMTNSDFKNADILEESYANVKKALGPMDENLVAVVTGFIGKDKDGHITTLGRGGSDLTATFLAGAVGADEIQVWKDVDGIMTADPRIVPTAIPVPEITFEEAAELAYFGAKVLHPISMRPAKRANIPVRVKNSYNPEHPGTVITGERSVQDVATAITVKNGITLLDIVSTRMLGQYGFLAKVFELFDKYEISVDMVATSEVSISLTLDSQQDAMSKLPKLLAELESIAEVDVLEKRSIVSIIANLEKSSELMGATFKILEDINCVVEMLSQGASKVNIGLVVDSSRVDDVIKALHKRFFEDKL